MIETLNLQILPNGPRERKFSNKLLQLFGEQQLSNHSLTSFWVAQFAVPFWFAH